MIFLACSICSICRAQTWDEWFRQDKTQIKYLTQQIAKLQLYLSYVKKGYKIVDKGLTLIGDIKDGDFNLHKSYFDGLGLVNPAIRKYKRVSDIISMQAEMLTAYKKYNKLFRESGAFASNEIDYLYRVFSTLLDEVTEDISELTTLITDGSLEMTDDERIKRIDEVFVRMQEKHSFLFSFCRKTNTQQLQRLRELHEIETLKKLYYP